MKKREYNPVLVDLMSQRKNAYILTLGGPDLAHRAQVMADLSRFCREKQTCFHVDPRLHALIEGRREVILRIKDYLDLSVEELCEKYGKD
jgi:hypothetical protein